MFKGIHQTSISTPNLERMIGFYRDLLGFEECTRYGWSVGSHGLDKVVGVKVSSGDSVMLTAGNSIIKITQYHTPRPRPADPARLATQHGISHLCIDVRDLDAEYERLLAAGVVFDSKPHFVLALPSFRNPVLGPAALRQCTWRPRQDSNLRRTS